MFKINLAVNYFSLWQIAYITLFKSYIDIMGI